MNEIIRPIADDLGFDKHGQLNVKWREHDSTYSTVIADMRDKTCCICGKGWEVTAPSFRNQLKTSTTDEWCHKTCMMGHLALTEAEMFYTVLCDARDKARIAWQWKQIPNEYGAAWKTPWYLVQFEGYVPTVKLGCRKRVYSMSMHDLRPEQVEAFLPMVKDEDVTKGTEGRGSIYIHAWGREKVLEYMRHFYAILQMDTPIPDSNGAIITEFKTNAQS